MGTVIGWGLHMVRILAWQREAALRMKGLSMARNASVAAWRQQTGSTVGTWAKVHAEAQGIVAVESMCRLLWASAGWDMVYMGDEPARELGWCDHCGKVVTEIHPCRRAS